MCNVKCLIIIITVLRIQLTHLPHRSINLHLLFVIDDLLWIVSTDGVIIYYIGYIIDLPKLYCIQITLIRR